MDIKTFIRLLGIHDSYESVPYDELEEFYP